MDNPHFCGHCKFFDTIEQRCNNSESFNSGKIVRARCLGCAKYTSKRDQSKSTKKKPKSKS